MYVITMQKHRVAGFHGQLAHEALERLDQLNYLGSEVVRFQHLFETELPKEGEVENRTDPLFQMTLLTDSFYFIAFRFLDLVNSPDKPLPGLHGLEARGVRDVRNHLLAHPEGRRSRVFTRSWGFDGSRGPVMKPFRSDDEPAVYADAGLFINAFELAAAVCKRLRTVIGAYDTA